MVQTWSALGLFERVEMALLFFCIYEGVATCTAKEQLGIGMLKCDIHFVYSGLEVLYIAETEL